MKIEMEPKKKRRKRGSFFGAVTFFLFFLVLIVAGVVGAAYINRDRLIIEYIRQEGPKAFGLEVLAIDSLVTRPIGQVSIELRGIVFQSSKQAPLVRAEKVVLSIPKNLLELYQLVFTRETLTLKAQLVAVQIQALSHGENAAPAAPINPSQTGYGFEGLPFPVVLETEFRDSQLEVGPASNPVRIKGLTGLVRTHLKNKLNEPALDIKSSGQLALQLEIGEKNALPLRTDWALSAEPRLSDPSNIAIQITSLTVSTLGMSLKSRGSLKWPEQNFQLEATGSTNDLGVLPLDKAESDALGLMGRLKGSAEVQLKVEGKLDSLVRAEGLIRLKEAQFPFSLSRQTPRPFELRGPVDVDLETPFKVSYDVPNAKVKSLELELATFKADLTAADIRVPGLLRKAPALMLGLSGQVTAQGETIEIGHLEFRFANLLLNTKGQASLNPKRLSKLEIAMTLPSLTGWPALLPVLGTLERDASTTAEEMNRAKGSFALKAKVELPLGAPENFKTESKIDVEVFEASGLEIPLNIRNAEAKQLIQGIARGHLTASGLFQMTPDPKKPVNWTIRRTVGSFDLKNLAIAWGELLNKAKDRELSATFSATSTGPSLKFDKFEARLLDSKLNLQGQITQQDSGNISLDTSIQAQTALSQMYEMIPMLRSLRAKIPSGSLFATMKVNGTYLPKEGPSQSPLTLGGRLGFKGPQAVLLEVSKTAPSATGTETKPSDENPLAAYLKWPLVDSSKVIFDIQLDSISMKTTTMKGFKTLATLEKGGLTGQAEIANAFGGSVKVSSFAIPSLTKTKPADIKLSSNVTFAALNLSAMADFMNPQWKALVGGNSNGTISLTAKPLSPESMIETSTATGSIDIKQGFLSTVGLDQLVNQKLAEYPLIAKLTGAQPKVATKGVALNLASAFSFAKGRMDLKNLVALSPEKNELRLQGWLQKDFSVDLKGQAFLADTPIGGSFRQANSDKTGRLVVPIRITGSLKEPSVDIAEEALKEMADKTLKLEARKLKSAVREKAGQALEQKKKEAVDAIKEELKKRGLSF